MSLFCSISGQPPLVPVLSSKSGHVYEKELVLKYLRDNDSRDPITGEVLALEDLVEIKTAPSTPSAPPRPPTFTSVPSLLHTLQSEWDSTMFECLELRRAGGELRQELSHALYKEDAAMRVLARVTRERDEAREALASVRATLGPAFSTAAPADTAMEVEEESAGLQGSARSIVQDTAKTLGSTRKKRKPAADYATADALKTFTQTLAIPSLHGAKPPGISALDLGHAAASKLMVTGGLDKTVQVYDRSTGKIVANLKGHTKKVTSVLFSNSCTEEGYPTHIICASLDKSVRVFTPSGTKTLYALSANLANAAEVNAIALHPSGSLVASACADGTFSIIDLTTEKATSILTLPASIDADAAANTAIAFHADGAMVAVGSADATIRIYDILTGACVATFSEYTSVANVGAITSLSFSENGYVLAAAAVGTSNVKLFDLRKLTNFHSIDLPEANVVNALAWDNSAQFLAIVGTDLRVLQNKTWEELILIEENASELTGLGWGEKGSEIIVAGMDRTARIIAAPVVEA